MDDSGGTLLLVGVIFLGVSAVMLGLGIFFFVRTRRFLRSAVDATGTILELRESSGSEGGTVYSAVVEFRIADGRTIRWEESMASNPPAGRPGEQLAMKYDPANRSGRASPGPPGCGSCPCCSVSSACCSSGSAWS